MEQRQKEEVMGRSWHKANRTDPFQKKEEEVLSRRVKRNRSPKVPAAAASPPTQIWDILKSFYYQNFWRIVVLSFVSITLILMQNIIFPHAIGNIVSDSRTYRENFLFLTALVIMILLNQFVQGKMEADFFPDLNQHIRMTLLDKLFTDNQMRYEEIASSSFITILNKFAMLIVNFFEILKYVIVPNVLIVIFVLVYLFVMHFSLGIGLLLIVALYGFFIWKTVNNCKNTNIQKLRLSNHLDMEIENLISNILNINITGQKNVELAKLEDLEKTNSSLMKSYFWCNKSFHSMSLTISYSVFLVIPVISMILLNRRLISQRNVISIFLVTIFLHNALSGLTYSTQPTANMFDEIKNMDENLNRHYFNHTVGASANNNSNANAASMRRSCPKKSMAPTVQRYVIEVKNVSFSYGDNAIFRDFSLFVVPNSIYGIYGKNGSGKTTLIKLLMGFETAQKGQVKVFGTDIHRIELDCLRRIFRLVPQKHNLFNTTIISNILYGNTGLTEGYVRDFLRKNKITSFDNLRLGLNTRVGIRGEGISGGQRQIILVLRALLSDSPIIILDEPSSQLDYSTSETLIKLLRVMKRDKTILIITHDQKLDKVIEYKVHVGNSP